MHCTLCPRSCGADRLNHPGFCHAGAGMRIARAAPHMWEEPPLSGTSGSGAIFFSGCPLGCAFCQNHTISHTLCGQPVTTEELARIMLRLEQEGVHNIDLITATPYREEAIEATTLARQKGLSLPIVWNTGGYETLETIDLLAENTVDIWLADLKFFSPALSAQLANAPEYFEHASRALLRMLAHTGPPVFDENGLIKTGVILRLLVLPGQKEDMKQILHWLAAHLQPDQLLLSLMSQYTPPPALTLPRPFHRRVSSYEYNDVVATAMSLGFETGFTQARTSAKPTYTPPFDLTGLHRTEE